MRQYAWRRAAIATLVLACLAAAGALWRGGASAQSELPPAEIVNDEGGPVAITGELRYTNPFFTTGVAAPLIILEDQAGFIDRNPAFVLPRESQTIGQITSDFQESPFSYSLALPIEPQGTLRDVDQDGGADIGVMVFAVAYWTNKFGDPFLEERDLFGGGWSTAYASTRASDRVSDRQEIVGGKMLVYAPDAEQGFPVGFGEDGRLFTADDPVARLPQGYSIADLDSEPFTFDRSRYPEIDLIEPEAAAIDDFSALSYSAAFDAMLEKLRSEYAFTEHKGIDWDAMSAEFRPRFVAAEQERSRRAYMQALRDFALAIPDGHVQGPFLEREFVQTNAGGLGMALTELDDGSVIVSYLLEDGPADAAGIEVRVEVISIQGTPIQEYLAQIEPWTGPFSTEHTRRLEQIRFAVRFPINMEVEVGFRNPGDGQAQTVMLTAVGEIESLFPNTTDIDLAGLELPVEFRRLEGGYVYASVNSFLDDEVLTVRLWERLMAALNEYKIDGLIIDLRRNLGGNGFLADQMAAYLFDEPVELGNAARYNAESKAFYIDPRTAERFILPEPELRYHGAAVVLIGPTCSSACEFFAYNLTRQNRSVTAGMYPTAGLGGSIDQFLMPGGETFQFTAGRSVDPNGEIHVEGKGVAPMLRVPVTEHTVFAEDAVLDAAVEYLDQVTSE